MSEEEQSAGWLQEVFSGGLPQLLAGPAGKAISRLIGAGVEIPAAWLEQKAQSIRDETEARSTVMTTLAEKSAELGLENPQLLNRGLDNLLGRAYREQQNREAVAVKTLEILSDAQEPTGEGPTDDWLNVFEGHAAKATSEELRSLFAKVLAGEIRQPGEFSLHTLHMVSVLDASLAEKIEQIAVYVWDGKFALQEAAKSNMRYDDLLALDDAGFLTMGAGTLSATLAVGTSGTGGIRSAGIGVAGFFEPDKQVKIPAYPLSRAGRELFQILDVNPDVDAACRALWKLKPSSVVTGKLTKDASGEFTIGEYSEYPKPE